MGTRCTVARLAAALAVAVLTIAASAGTAGSSARQVPSCQCTKKECAPLC